MASYGGDYGSYGQYDAPYTEGYGNGGIAGDSYGGAYQGGGFMNSSQGSGGSMDGQHGQQQGSAFETVMTSESVTPVTLRQIKMFVKNENSRMELDGRAVQRVSFVGRIVGLKKSNKLGFVDLDDGTSRLSMRWLLEYVDHLEAFEVGMFIKGDGGLSSSTDGGSCGVKIYKLEPIEDHNLIMHHFLDVMLTHHRVLNNDTLPASVAAAKQNDPAQNHMIGYGPGMGQRVDIQPSGYTNDDGLDFLTRQVHAVFNENKENEAGLSLQEVYSEICGKLGGDSKYNFDDVRKVIHELSNEGHLYSTSDDDHYRST